MKPFGVKPHAEAEEMRRAFDDEELLIQAGLILTMRWLSVNRPDVTQELTNSCCSIVASNIATVLRCTESPIERFLFGSFVMLFTENEPLRLIVHKFERDIRDVLLGDLIPANIQNEYVFLFLQPVFKLDEKTTIRPDGLLWFPAKPRLRPLVVECDGFETHGTKEAFIADRQRDRYLEEEGFSVVRFSGSEIYADPDLAARNLGRKIAL